MLHKKTYNFSSKLSPFKNIETLISGDFSKTAEKYTSQNECYQKLRSLPILALRELAELGKSDDSQFSRTLATRSEKILT